MDSADKSKDQTKAQETTQVDEREFAVKHPLQHSWVLWYDKPEKKSNQSTWSDQLKKIYTFSTVEDFWSLWNNIKSANELTSGCNYHIFKDGIQPMWEDDTNKRGGKWVIITKAGQRNTKLNQMWLGAVLAVIGCAYDDDDEICGVVVCVRKQFDKICLWTRSADKKDVCLRIGEQFRASVDAPNEHFGYQDHLSAMQNDSSFRNQIKYELSSGGGSGGVDGGSSDGGGRGGAGRRGRGGN